jgi:hypothetical protein
MTPLDIVPCEPMHARMTAASCVSRHCAAQTLAGWRTGMRLEGCLACPVGAARAELLGVAVPAATVRPTYVAGITAESGPCSRCRTSYRVDLIDGVEVPLLRYCPNCRAQAKKQAGLDIAARAEWLATSHRVSRGSPSGRSRIASLPPVSG